MAETITHTYTLSKIMRARQVRYRPFCSDVTRRHWSPDRITVSTFRPDFILRSVSRSFLTFTETSIGMKKYTQIEARAGKGKLKSLTLIHIAQEGEEITTCYLKPDQATFARRQFLHEKWNFWCACQRCASPSELGSFCGGQYT